MNKIAFVGGLVLGAALLLPFVSAYLIKAMVSAGIILVVLYAVINMMGGNDENNLSS